MEGSKHVRNCIPYTVMMLLPVTEFYFLRITVMGTVCSPVMIVQAYQTTRRHKPEHTDTGVQQLLHTKHNTFPCCLVKPMLSMTTRQ